MDAITSRIGKYSPDDDDSIIYEVSDAQGIICALYLDPEHHMIENVETRDDRLHEGFATRLFAAADDEIGAFLAPEFCRTSDGQGWADHMENEGYSVMDVDTAEKIVYGEDE
jgi:hypothetical protein